MTNRPTPTNAIVYDFDNPGIAITHLAEDKNTMEISVRMSGNTHPSKGMLVEVRNIPGVGDFSGKIAKVKSQDVVDRYMGVVRMEVERL
jgi:hypothetical protein